MKTLIVNHHTKHLAELETVFPGAKVIDPENMRETKFDDFDLVVISGGSDVPTVVNHADLYDEDFSMIKQSTTPIIGICLGCEIICKAFGGEVAFLPETERGKKDFEIVDDTLSAVLGTEKISAYEFHSVGIANVPANFNVLVRSNHGPEVIKHRTRPIIGIQFHPEVAVNQKFLDWIIHQILLQ